MLGLKVEGHIPSGWESHVTGAGGGSWWPASVIRQRAMNTGAQLASAFYVV